MFWIENIRVILWGSMFCFMINCMCEHGSDWTTGLKYWIKYIDKF